MKTSRRLISLATLACAAAASITAQAVGVDVAAFVTAPADTFAALSMLGFAGQIVAVGDTAPSEFAPYMLLEEGRIAIVQPNGKPMLYSGQPVAVVVYGPGTDQFAKADAARVRQLSLNQYILHATASGSAKASDTAKPTDENEINANFLAGITKHVENFPFPGGVLAMYRARGLLYLHRQVNAYADKMGNFFPDSEPS